MGISLCMIVKDEVEGLDRCLDSAAPHVDEVVVVQTYPKRRRRQNRILRKHKAKRAKFEWCDDFGAARQFSFELAAHPWRFWLDADDVLEGGEELGRMVAALDPDRWPVPQAALSMPYFYGHDDHGNCITILTRTRVVFWPHGWQWRRRVHEDLQPLAPVEIGRQVEVAVRHWPRVAGVQSAERNLGILLQEYEEDPGDARTLAYLGHQYFALQDWAAAVQWYERYLAAERAITMETWQAAHFLAVCYRNLGELASAADAELRAIQMAPEYADPYYGLAAVALQAGSPEEALHWHQLGLAGKMASGAIFMNPLEYSYNPTLTSNVALEAVGDLQGALAEVARGLQVRPEDAYLLSRQEELEAKVGRMQTAGAFVRVAQKASPAVVQAMAELLGAEVLQEFPASRDALARANFDQVVQAEGAARVVILCGESAEPFGPEAVARGMGGSETAVVRVGQELARLGYQVLVFNNPGAEVGEAVPGLWFWPWQWWDPGMRCDLFVAWRQPELARARPKNGAPAWLWMHDVHVAERLTLELARRFDLIRPVSDWAGDMLRLLYPFLRERDVVATRNGTDLVGIADFDRTVEQRRRLVYASSPDRGLDHLLRMWPEVRAAVVNHDPTGPQPELHIYYGWDLYDRAMVARQDRQMRKFKAEIKRLARAPGVYEHGRASKADLAAAWRECGVWAYPTEFLEVSCITAMDAMGAGAAIVTSRHGALPETLGNVGFQLEGPAGGVAYQQRFMGYLVNVLTDKEAWAAAAAGGPERAKELTWRAVAEEWAERLG